MLSKRRSTNIPCTWTRFKCRRVLRKYCLELSARWLLHVVSRELLDSITVFLHLSDNNCSSSHGKRTASAPIEDMDPSFNTCAWWWEYKDQGGESKVSSVSAPALLVTFGELRRITTSHVERHVHIEKRRQPLPTWAAARLENNSFVIFAALQSIAC